MKPTKEQQEALSEVFQEVSAKLDDMIEQVLGRPSDIVLVVHLEHEGDEPCDGAIVLSNNDDMEATYIIMNHGIVAVGENIRREYGDDGPTKH